MFELMMTYCLLGKPCVNETVANFPQFDVGQHICELAKPAIERGVRSRAPASTRITFVCQEATGGDQVEYEYQQPRQHEPDYLKQLPRIIEQGARYIR